MIKKRRSIIREFARSRFSGPLVWLLLVIGFVTSVRPGVFDLSLSAYRLVSF